MVDPGIALDENLAAIRERKCHYIVASRQAERNAWPEEFESGDWEEVKRTPTPTNPAQRKSKVLVKRAERDGETCILCISEGRSSKDAAIRRSHEERLIRPAETGEARGLGSTQKAREDLGDYRTHQRAIPPRSSLLLDRVERNRPEVGGERREESGCRNPRWSVSAEDRQNGP